MSNRKAVSVIFSGSQNRYDYWCDFPVEIGANVIVETRRGDATVIVVDVKDDSDKATASVKRLANLQPELSSDRTRPF